jgi:hypothetical protein
VAEPKQGDREHTIEEFRAAVNMTAGQLERLLGTDDSRAVGQKDGGESTGHRSGRRIVRLLRTAEAKYSAGDLAHMRKVVGYVRRHTAQRPEGTCARPPGGTR